MRHHQPHKSDHPGHSHAARCHAACASQQPQAGTGHIKPGLGGLLVAKGKHIQGTPAKGRCQQARHKGCQQQGQAAPSRHEDPMIQNTMLVTDSSLSALTKATSAPRKAATAIPAKMTLSRLKAPSPRPSHSAQPRAASAPIRAAGATSPA